MKSDAAANVIDFEAFRQKKLREERGQGASPTEERAMAQMMVPVWFCWVPVWTPFVG